MTQWKPPTTNPEDVELIDLGYSTTITGVVENVTGTPATGEIELEQGLNKLYIQVPTLASCTFTPYISLDGASWATIQYDIDGRTFPADSFTGGVLLTFIVPPAGGYIGFTSSGVSQTGVALITQSN